MGRDCQPLSSPSRASALPLVPFPFWFIPSEAEGNSPSLIAEEISSLFSNTYGSPFCNPSVFKFMHGMGGGVPPSSTFRRRPDPSPFFSNSCALRCTFLRSSAKFQKLNSFIFRRFRTLRQKSRGMWWGRGLLNVQRFRPCDVSTVFTDSRARGGSLARTRRPRSRWPRRFRQRGVPR